MDPERLSSTVIAALSAWILELEDQIDMSGEHAANLENDLAEAKENEQKWADLLNASADLNNQGNDEIIGLRRAIANGADEIARLHDDLTATQKTADHFEAQSRDRLEQIKAIESNLEDLQEEFSESRDEVERLAAALDHERKWDASRVQRRDLQIEQVTAKLHQFMKSSQHWADLAKDLESALAGAETGAALFRNQIENLKMNRELWINRMEYQRQKRYLARWELARARHIHRMEWIAWAYAFDTQDIQMEALNKDAADLQDKVDELEAASA